MVRVSGAERENNSMRTNKRMLRMENARLNSCGLNMGCYSFVKVAQTSSCCLWDSLEQHRNTVNAPVICVSVRLHSLNTVFNINSTHSCVCHHHTALLPVALWRSQPPSCNLAPPCVVASPLVLSVHYNPLSSTARFCHVLLTG